MSLRPVMASTEVHSRELPIDPWAVGALTLFVLLVLLVALFAFGKGRDHT